jgi:excisionase family DNA binding protein
MTYEEHQRPEDLDRAAREYRPGATRGPQMESLLRVRDVARLLAVSEGTVYRLIEQGDLPPPIKVHRRLWLWSRETIQADLDRLAARYGAEVTAASALNELATTLTS